MTTQETDLAALLQKKAAWWRERERLHREQGDEVKAGRCDYAAVAWEEAAELVSTHEAIR